MNIFILKFLLSIIIGICLGLYLKNIALFVYILIIIIFLVNHKKNNFNILFIIFSVIICFIASYSDEKYENLYNENITVSGVGEIISFAEEKEYKNKYIIKIKEINGDLKYENTKLILYVDKNINFEYGDIIYFYNSSFEKVSGKRNDKGFSYERYLRQSKIYGNLRFKNFEIISKNRGIRYNFFKFKNDLKELLYEIYQPENAGFLSGLLIRRYI